MSTPDDPLTLIVLGERLGIARLPPAAGMPGWLASDSWYSMTRTAEELSVVCEAHRIPHDVKHTAPWRALQVEGPLDFSLTGILHRITGPLAEGGISIFAVSTYDTDYVLVPEGRLEEAVKHLRRAGIVVRRPD